MHSLGDYMRRYGPGIQRVLSSFGPTPDFTGEQAKDIIKRSDEDKLLQRHVDCPDDFCVNFIWFNVCKLRAAPPDLTLNLQTEMNALIPLEQLSGRTERRDQLLSRLAQIKEDH
ncbi:hypothetical protein WMY93_001768 [Mugilogobius chulae]|uniref:Uncharacterized protein n=1 Tax=Mugilogobius chulae TaxID=88201 RepID=A0AAW0Q2J9_9GOBI